MIQTRYFPSIYNRVNKIAKIEVLSKLFYCSSMLACSTKEKIDRLQQVQNLASRIMTGTRKYDHITRCIQEILGIKISLIYHFLHQQQVSNLSQIGLLSSGIPFQNV